MSIRFSSKVSSFQLQNVADVRLWLERVIRRRGRSVGSISYLFCDDEEVHQYNTHYLNHDTYTDIITFDSVVGALVSGDIIISVERVGENAACFGVPFDQELRRVIVHGVLHLLGQGDKGEAEAAEMRRQEAAALGLWDEMFREEQ